MSAQAQAVNAAAVRDDKLTQKHERLTVKRLTAIRKKLQSAFDNPIGQPTSVQNDIADALQTVRRALAQMEKEVAFWDARK